MKKFIIALCFIPSLVLAQQVTETTTVSTSAASSAGGSVSVGCLVNCASTDRAQVDVANINAQALRDAANTTTVIKNTPNVNAPPLVSSNDTCMGSTSGSLNIAGVGFGGGSTWVDQNCKMLKNSRELWNMGMRGAALALMCTDKDNREALAQTGFACPALPEKN